MNQPIRPDLAERSRQPARRKPAEPAWGAFWARLAQRFEEQRKGPEKAA
jgi:hypothetical protein